VDQNTRFSSTNSVSLSEADGSERIDVAGAALIYAGRCLKVVDKFRIVKGGKRMSSYVLGFQDIDKTKIMVVGGKGANLGEISKVEGIRVPDGFCISTEAFKKIIGETPSINELLDQLSLLKVGDRNKISELSGEIRRLIERIAIPEDIH
jgi:rifampicin phosphotransferase